MDEIVVPEFVTAIPEDSQPSPDGEEHERKDYATLSNGILSPRHRKLAELFAAGRSNAQVAEELGYVASRISALKNNAFIAAEITRVKERIYEDTISNRLKAMADPALNVLEQALNDKTNRVKQAEKNQIAQWVIEKLDGKAAQKLELGGNMLGALLDKLDGLKAAGRTVVDSPDIEVTPRPALAEGQSQADAPQAEPISDELEDWIANF